jgi:hypothetical protein
MAGTGEVSARFSGSAVGSALSDLDNADKLVLEFLRQRLNEDTTPIRPEVVADALPLSIDDVTASLTRLYEGGRIEGATVQERGYPVMVTRVL